MTTILSVTICTHRIIPLIVMFALKQRGRSYQMSFAYPYLASTEAIEIPDDAQSQFMHIQARLRCEYHA